MLTETKSNELLHDRGSKGQNTHVTAVGTVKQYTLITNIYYKYASDVTVIKDCSRRLSTEGS